MHHRSLNAHQRGIALPVMLIMLLVMLVTSIYLLRSTNSTTLAVSNMAYDASLSRAADLGLHTGFQWLKNQALANKALLNKDIAASGYSATMNPGASPRDAAFWENGIEIDGADSTRVEYVIHRLCRLDLPYDDKDNTCVQSAEISADLGNPVPVGESVASDAPVFAGSPQLHYVITARIAGARGGNVVNQMVVLLGV